MQFRKGVSCVKVMYRSSSPKGQRQRGWNVFLSGFQSTCSWPGLLPQPRHSAHGPLLIAARMDNLQLAFHQSQRVLCDILYFLRGRGVVLLGLHFHDLRGHGIFPGHPLNCSYDSAGPGPTDLLVCHSAQNTAGCLDTKPYSNTDHLGARLWQSTKVISG